MKRSARPLVQGWYGWVRVQRIPSWWQAFEDTLVSGAVVGEHAAHADAAGVEVRDGAFEEGGAVGGPQTRTQLEVAEPARAVDRHVGVLPADRV